MPLTISDANSWYNAPGGSMPQEGFGTFQGDDDWFHIGALTPGQAAKVSVLPDYLLLSANGVNFGLIAESVVGASLYQRVSVTGNIDNALHHSGYFFSDAFVHGSSALYSAGNSVTLPDQILQHNYPGPAASGYSFEQIVDPVPASRTIT